jgi:hypothetical protein
MLTIPLKIIRMAVVFSTQPRLMTLSTGLLLLLGLVVSAFYVRKL